jgi:hypothetical protein
MSVNPTLLVLLIGKETGLMQDSAKTISVAIQNYLRWNENEQSANTAVFKLRYI